MLNWELDSPFNKSCFVLLPISLLKSGHRYKLSGHSTCKATSSFFGNFPVIGTPGPVVFKVEGCGHQRSESSTDSFVCVSEDTGLDGEVATSNRDVADTESWEQLGSELGGCSRDSRAKLSEMGDGDSNGGLGDQKVQSLLQSIELITDGDVKETQKNGDDVESSSSDWEKWDD